MYYLKEFTSIGKEQIAFIRSSLRRCCYCYCYQSSYPIYIYIWMNAFNKQKGSRRKFKTYKNSLIVILSLGNRIGESVAENLESRSVRMFEHNEKIIRKSVHSCIELLRRNHLKINNTKSSRNWTSHVRRLKKLLLLLQLICYLESDGFNRRNIQLETFNELLQT